MVIFTQFIFQTLQILKHLDLVLSIHCHILMTSYVGFIYSSYSVATGSWSNCSSCGVPWSYSKWSYHAIEGFHVTSYQANFASHHTRDGHVGFLFTWSGIGKYNKMSRYFLLSSYHNTKLQLSDKNICTYSRWKFYFFLWSKLKVQAFLLFFSIPHHTKGNHAAGAK